MSKFKELLEKVADAELKAQLDSEFTEVNRKAGENGRKLMEKDTEMGKLRGKLEESASFADAFNVLKKSGISADQIPTMLSKLGVVKTLEDDLFMASQALKDRDTELADLRKFKKTSEVRNAVGKFLAEERANFKDETGKAIEIIPRYLPEEKLYADIDVSNEVLIRERVKSVLKDGLQAQETAKKEFGFQGSETHTVPEGQGGPGQNTNLAAQIKDIAQKQGVVAGFDALLRLKEGT